MTQKIEVNGREYPLAPMDPPVAESPSSEYLAITPSVAQSWLKRNLSNRGLRAIASNAQGRDMAHGWDINGETIIFSRPVKEGEVEGVRAGEVLLNDGQHRLTACAEGTAPFVSLVAYGVEPETRRSVDSGIGRTMSDVLNMQGENLAPIMASLLRRMLMVEAGVHQFGSSRMKVTKAECEAYLKKDPDALRRACEMGAYVRTTFRFVGPTVVAQAYYMTSKVSPEQAPWFFARLRDGAELPVGHPILALRARFQNDHIEKKRVIPNQQLSYIFRAWNAVRQGRDLGLIIHPPEKPIPKLK